MKVSDAMITSKEFRQGIEELSKKVYKDGKFRDTKILITGASGLIGSVLVDVFLMMNDLNNTNITIIALGRSLEHAKNKLGEYFERSDFQFLCCDVNNVIPELGEVDYIIHAASNTHPIVYSTDPIGTITANVIGTKNLLDYGRIHNIKRFVFLSSVEIYGENRGDTEKFTENYCGYIDCNTVRAGYPESKRIGESLCCAYHKQYQMDIVIPRLCRVYGPTMDQSDSKAIAQFIKNAVNGEDIVLKSEGFQNYSYLYVLDAASAIIKIMMKGKCGEAYNASSEFSDIKMKELTQKIAKLAGTKVIFEIPNAVEQSGYSTATKAILDNTKLKKLGWEEMYDIDGGLKMTIGILKELKNQ